MKQRKNCAYGLGIMYLAALFFLFLIPLEFYELKDVATLNIRLLIACVILLSCGCMFHSATKHNYYVVGEKQGLGVYLFGGRKIAEVPWANICCAFFIKGNNVIPPYAVFLSSFDAKIKGHTLAKERENMRGLIHSNPTDRDIIKLKRGKITVEEFQSLDSYLFPIPESEYRIWYN